MLTFMLTDGGLTFMNNSTPISLTTSHPKFDRLVELIKKGILGEDGVTYRQATGDDLQNVYEEDRRALQAAIHAADGELTQSLSIEDGVLRYNNIPLDNYVAKKLIQMVKEGFVENNPLIPFIEKLMKNPSRRAVHDLYPFLEFGKNSVDPEGNFIAFKAVRKDFTDIHTGTFDNSIGKVVKIPRWEVDEDPDRTCSHGLHVCSFDYLKSFAHADGHIIIVKVSPENVCAIPRDYNNTKMRVCEYEVIGEYEGYYKGGGNILERSAVYVARAFGVKFRPNEKADFEVLETFDSIQEAGATYEEACEEHFEVQLYNTATEAVIAEHLDASLREAPAGEEAGASLVPGGEEDDDRWTVNAYNSLDDYEDSDEAVSEKVIGELAQQRAIELMEDYPIVEIIDEDGDVLKTYGYKG